MWCYTRVMFKNLSKHSLCKEWLHFFSSFLEGALVHFIFLFIKQERRGKEWVRRKYSKGGRQEQQPTWAAAQNTNWPEVPPLLKDVHEQVDSGPGILHGRLWTGQSLTVAALQWCGHLFSLLYYQSLVWDWLKNLFRLLAFLLSALLSLLMAVCSQGGLGFLP